MIFRGYLYPLYRCMETYKKTHVAYFLMGYNISQYERNRRGTPGVLSLPVPNRQFRPLLPEKLKKNLKIGHFLWPSITYLNEKKKKKNGGGFSLVDLAWNSPYTINTIFTEGTMIRVESHDKS